ncbi:MAG: O-antigen ligase family protein [Elusimicrobia bacterium]|nr:O-antigen ligase family protein [Elusimicrobiota bacterium]
MLGQHRALVGWASIIHVVAPLFFFTQLTQNPYSIQILILHVGLWAAWCWILLTHWNCAFSWPARTWIDKPLLALGGWATLTWLLSMGRHGDFFRPGLWHEGLRGQLFVWVNAIGAFFLSALVATGDRAFFFRRLLLAVAGVSAVYGIAQFLGVDPIWGSQLNPFAGRPISTYGNPNFLSSALVLFIPLALHEWLKSRSIGASVGWGTLVLVYVAALVATMTRSSWIGLAGGLAVFVVLDRAQFRRKLPWVTLMAGILAALVLFWPTSELGAARPIHRMVELWNGVTGQSVYASWHQRLMIWRCAWDMWAENPLTGKGWGSFELFFPYYQGRWLLLDLFQTFKTHSNNAHNLILEIGSQTGLVGLGLGVLLALITVRGQIQHTRSTSAEKSLTSALFAGMVGMVIDNLFGNVSLFFAIPGFLFFWVWGQWAVLALSRPAQTPWSRWALRGLTLLVVLAAVWIMPILVRAFMGEAGYLRATQPARLNSGRGGEEQLLRAQRLKPHDVHINFELGNLYSRRMIDAQSRGYEIETATNAEKAWAAYTQALRSNPSYDEIFSARARTAEALRRIPQARQDARLARLLDPRQAPAVSIPLDP